MAWDHVTITLMHYYPPSKGARVLVTGPRGFIVRSGSGEGVTVDDPNIKSFLAWAQDYYRGAKFQEVGKP